MTSFRSTTHLILFGTLVFFISFFILVEKVQAAPIPPVEALCDARGDSGQVYECSKEGENIAKNIGVLLTLDGATNVAPFQCFEACWFANGAVLTYNETGSKDNNYCFGAEENRTCEAYGEIIGVQSGVLSKEEIADLPEDCGASLPCHFRNLIKAVGSFAGTSIVFLLGVVANIVGIVFTGIAKVFGWVIGNIASIPVSPNNPNTVNIVKDGWGISRDIANMFFIIILSFIGLATILGLESYQAKKTLPRLLIIALLINFSGVLVGFIVDIGNLFANFFLQKATGLEWSLAWPDTATSGSEIAQKAAGYIARIIFYLVASFIYAAIAFLFFIRVFYLWTLAILAPLAFAANILPATKKYWTQWWDQLIQWSILAIPMSFFIYLSRLALENTTKTNAIASGAGPIASFMGPFLALFLLFLGITLSSSTAQNVTKGFLGAGKKAGMWGGAIMGTAAWRKVQTPIDKFGENVRKRGQGEEIKAGEATRMERVLGKIPGAGALGKSTIGKFGSKTLGTAMELSTKDLTMRMKAKDELEYKNYVTEGTGKDAKDNITKFRQEKVKGVAANRNRMLGLLNATIANGDAEDINEAIEAGMIDREDIKKTIEVGKRVGPPGYRPLAKAFYGQMMTNPESFGYSKERNAKTGKFEDEWLGHLENELPKKISNQEIVNDSISDDNLNPKTEAGQYFLKKMVEERDADLLPGLARRPKKEERERLMKYVFEDMYGDKETTRVELSMKAPGALRYINSTAARSAGVGADINPGEVTRLLTAAGLLKENKGLEAPYEILRAIRSSEDKLTRDYEKGAPKDALNKLEEALEDKRKIVETQVSQVAAKSPNPIQVEEAWDQIEIAFKATEKQLNAKKKQREKEWKKKEEETKKDDSS